MGKIIYNGVEYAGGMTALNLHNSSQNSHEDIRRLIDKNLDTVNEIIDRLDNDKVGKTDGVFYSYEEAVMYASSSSDAYVGQSITVIDTFEDTVTVYVIANSRMELDSVGGAAHVIDYINIDNKPKINDVVLLGNKTSEDLGVETYALSNSDIESIFTE